MKNTRDAILQALVILAASAVVGFAFNAASRNGIDPFKRPAAVPVVSDGTESEADGIRIITLDEVRRLIEEGTRIVDARRKAEYDEGHIPGALLLDYYDMGTYMDQVLPLLSDEQEIVVYCSEVSCDDSELLARELYLLGFKKMLVFKGGFAEWSAAGLPIEGGAQ
jgi:rhodanese-related sulfurtransferase